MTTPRDILDALLADDATAPRLTWYGTEGERIELSARVLDNWVSKAANLLVEEADLRPGDPVLLDLPAGHWRAFYWALAIWTCGGNLRLDEEDAEVAVSAEPTALSAGKAPVQILVSLPVLARSAAGRVPEGALDEAADLATYGDVFVSAEETDSAETALTAPDGQDWSFTELPVAPPTAGHRFHLDARHIGQHDLLRRALGIWAIHGSVVITRIEDNALPRILASEGVDG
ncbi:TIGR03089 family protein [Austwickia chelonae]|uniref:TIGR03089 family protein n=1 Tax=Austwickia chelonae TaxID=100225 RepID=UPI000E22836C|nr:TIGR03089 family protein [Austwickia chelonae]